MTSRWSRTYARHGCSSCRRRLASAAPGFTLIEVVVAVAVLLIVSISVLRFSVVSYDWGTNLVIRSMAQNLAELTAEQLAASSVGQIQGMIKGTPSPNFPANGTGLSSSVPPVPPTDGTYHVIAPGEFLITGITSFFPESSSQIDLPTGQYGTISALAADPRVTPTPSETMNDLGIFGEGLPTPGASYSTYLYWLAPNVAIEPMGPGDPAWDYSGLVLFKSEFPGFLREIRISPLFSGTTDPTQMRYAYSVTVIWTLAAQKQMVSVAGERSYVY